MVEAANFIHDTGNFVSKDKLQLFYQLWRPRDREKGALCVAHGLGEHSGRYDNLVNKLLPMGWALFALDHRGHGKSQGNRGHVDSFSQYTDDLDAFIDLIKTKTQAPLFLFGHSLGGLIALSYALSYPQKIKGIVSSAAALKIAVEVPKWKTTLGNFMSNLWPTLSMNNEIDPYMLSHDADVVDAYKNDPLVHPKVTARWYTEFVAQIDWAHKNAHKLVVPCLILQGTGDKLVHPDGSREFFEKIQIGDKTFKSYEGLYHELINELRKDEPLNDIAIWLDEHLKKLTA